MVCLAIWIQVLVILFQMYQFADFWFLFSRYVLLINWNSSKKIYAIKSTPSIPEINWVKNLWAIVVCGFLMKSLKNHIVKIRKKSWVPFRSYLLNSKANPAHFPSNWLGWLCYLAGNSQTVPTFFFQIFRIYFLIISINNPQTIIPITFWLI